MSESDDVRSHISPFEQIRYLTEVGDEYWSARELMNVLGYAKWQRFREAIERAITACQLSGQEPSDHFTGIGKMVAIGSGAKRKVEDFHLSRYACYLIIQNADPDKEIVALGQTYFAVQTRRQEYTDAGRTLEKLNENQKRLVLRDELATHNTKLAAAAQGSGVVTSNDFAIFQDHGYRGLYGGLGAKDIHERKGLKRSQHILDHMGSAELAANLFRATQTEQKLFRDQVTGKEAANQTHFEVGRVVRRTIEELGGTMPEELPIPEQSIQQVRRQELDSLKEKMQLPLFPDKEAHQ
jgi:DNA-damage-inducible protein D